MILALSIVWFVIVMAFFIVFDYKKWLKHKDVQHKTEWWVKASCCIPSIASLSYLESDKWYLAVPIVCCMLGFIWMEFFNGFYNKMIGFGWQYLGSPIGKEDDSWWDEQLRKLKVWQYVLFKTVGIVLFTSLYIAL